METEKVKQIEGEPKAVRSERMDESDQEDWRGSLLGKFAARKRDADKREVGEEGVRCTHAGGFLEQSQ